MIALAEREEDTATINDGKQKTNKMHAYLAPSNARSVHAPPGFHFSLLTEFFFPPLSDYFCCCPVMTLSLAPSKRKKKSPRCEGYR
jgi:hypothetical protein